MIPRTLAVELGIQKISYTVFLIRGKYKEVGNHHNPHQNTRSQCQKTDPDAMNEHHRSINENIKKTRAQISLQRNKNKRNHQIHKRWQKSLERKKICVFDIC